MAEVVKLGLAAVEVAADSDVSRETREAGSAVVLRAVELLVRKAVGAGVEMTEEEGRLIERAVGFLGGR